MSSGYPEITSRGTFSEATEDPGRKVNRLAEEARKHYFAALEWAERKLPDEHLPFAATAALTLRRATGRWPTAEQVLARLAEQGRTVEQMGAGHRG